MALTRRNLLPIVVLCCGASAVFVLAFVMLRQDTPVSKGTPSGPEPLPPEPLPPVPMAEAKQTTVVPTLDTPLIEGQSIVWCASFQLAWDRLKADITRGPVQLRNAEAVADRLNRARVSD